MTFDFTQGLTGCDRATGLQAAALSRNSFVFGNQARTWLLVRTSVLVLTLMLMAACSKTVEWTEEVELSNGETLVIERQTKHRPGGASWPHGTGWRPQMYVIRFSYPPKSDRVVEWRSTKMDLERGTEPEFPLVLDRDKDGAAMYVITINGLRGFCYEYVRYVYGGGVWSEMPLPAEFTARDANLYLAAAGLDLTEHVTSSLKLKENADIRYSEVYRKIGPSQRNCGA